MKRDNCRRERPALLRVVVPLIVLLLGVLVCGAVAGTAAADAHEEMDGTGTEDDPYVITTVEQLQAVNEEPSAHYVLGNDIDASETRGWNSGQGFEPIGTGLSERGTEDFSGTFDGQGHTIEGLYVDRIDSAGLFGGIDGGTVENVRLDGPTVRVADIRGGSLAGVVKDATIRDVLVTNAEVSGGNYVGGLLGELEEQSVVRAVSASVTIDAERLAGGLVGVISEDTRVVGAYTSGSVSAVGSAGGLADSVNGEIIASGSSARVINEGQDTNLDEAGGLVASLGDGTIRQSFATGEVNGMYQVGGLVGNAEGVISSSYATGEVTGRKPSARDLYVGGVAGEAETLDRTYWDRETTGLTDGNGDDDAESTGLSTAEMTGPAARENMDLNFGFAWLATDEYPIPDALVTELSVTLDESTVAVGSDVRVSINLELLNGDTISVERTADVDLDTSIATYDDGTIRPSTTGQTDVTVTLGDYQDSATLEVLTPPDIAITDQSLTAEGVLAGATANVTVELENTGGMDGTETINATVDGEEIGSQAVTVPGESEVTETLDWTVDEPGTVNVTANGRPLGTLTVVDPSAITLDSVSAPEEVDVGDSYAVETTIRNDADAAVGLTATAAIDGEERSQEVTALPGATTVEFETTAQEPDDREVTSQVTLLDQTAETTTTIAEQDSNNNNPGGSTDNGDDEPNDSDGGGDAEDDSPDTNSDDGGPGFGVVAAAVALLGGALLVRHGDAAK